MKNKTPLLEEWQAIMLFELMDDFYADPENRSAYKAWKKERRKERRRQKKKPAGAANTDELKG